MTARVRNSLLILTLLGFPLAPDTRAAEIPSDLSPASRDARDPEGKTDALDPVERAEQARSTPTQQGGATDSKTLTVIILVAAAVILIIFL